MLVVINKVLTVPPRDRKKKVSELRVRLCARVSL